MTFDDVVTSMGLLLFMAPVLCYIAVYSMTLIFRVMK